MTGGVVKNMSDGGLVQAVRNGDTTAFSRLYAVHVGAVTTVVRSNVHDQDAVADAVQEVFSRALERLGTLREPDRFRPWLLSIARHVAVDERRRRTRVACAEEYGCEDVATPEFGPAEAAELAELCRLVDGMVAGLSGRDASALSLAMHFGYTPTDIAATLGVTAGAAKVILHRARLRLRDAVALELLVRSHNDACPDVQEILRTKGRLPAARHIHRCPVCLAAAGDEVQLYQSSVRPVRDASAGVQPDDPDTHRADGVDQRVG